MSMTAWLVTPKLPAPYEQLALLFERLWVEDGDLMTIEDLDECELSITPSTLDEVPGSAELDPTHVVLCLSGRRFTPVTLSVLEVLVPFGGLYIDEEGERFELKAAASAQQLVDACSAVLAGDAARAAEAIKGVVEPERGLLPLVGLAELAQRSNDSNLIEQLVSLIELFNPTDELLAFLGAHVATLSEAGRRAVLTRLETEQRWALEADADDWAEANAPTASLASHLVAQARAGEARAIARLDAWCSAYRHGSANTAAQRRHLARAIVDAFEAGPVGQQLLDWVEELAPWEELARLEPLLRSRPDTEELVAELRELADDEQRRLADTDFSGL